MAFHKASILLSVAVVILADGLRSVYGQDDDFQWPGGMSSFDGLTNWSDDDNENSVGVDDLKGCCLPNTWTGKLFVEARTEGPRGRSLRFLEVAYVDQKNKRIATDDIFPRGRRNATTISTILLFGNSSATQYTFSKAKKRCAKKVIKNAKFRSMCIPANATLYGSFSLGAGSGALKTQAWGFLYRDPRVIIGANIILTPGNCIPVLENDKIFTRPRASDDVDDPEKKRRRPRVINLGILYTNITTTIRDPSVFTPPSYCNNKTDETLTFDPEFEYTTILERYVATP